MAVMRLADRLNTKIIDLFLNNGLTRYIFTLFGNIHADRVRLISKVRGSEVDLGLSLS